MNVPNMRGKKQTFIYGNDFLSITETLRKSETRIPRKGWTTNLRIAARETSKALMRREDQPTGGHGTRSPEPNGITSPRHALWNTTTKGKSSEEDHEGRGSVWTGATTKTQETHGRHHLRWRELDSPPDIGTVSTAS